MYCPLCQSVCLSSIIHLHIRFQVLSSSSLSSSFPPPSLHPPHKISLLSYCPLIVCFTPASIPFRGERDHRKQYFFVVRLKVNNKISSVKSTVAVCWPEHIHPHNHQHRQSNIEPCTLAIFVRLAGALPSSPPPPLPKTNMTLRSRSSQSRHTHAHIT